MPFRKHFNYSKQPAQLIKPALRKKWFKLHWLRAGKKNFNIT